MKNLLLIVALLLLASCTQYAYVDVHNSSGGNVSVNLDGQNFSLSSGSMETKKVEWSYDPVNTMVFKPISGSGANVSQFSDDILVSHKQTSLYYIYAD